METYLQVAPPKKIMLLQCIDHNNLLTHPIIDPGQLARQASTHIIYRECIPWQGIFQVQQLLILYLPCGPKSLPTCTCIVGTFTWDTTTGYMQMYVQLKKCFSGSKETVIIDKLCATSMDLMLHYRYMCVIPSCPIYPQYSFSLRMYHRDPPMDLHDIRKRTS